MNENNDDIKIFGETVEEDIADESQSLVLDLVVQKNNGNLERARSLGVDLAGEVVLNDGDFSFSSKDSENEDVLLQRRLLLAFTVDHALNQYCPNGIVAEIASSSFFQTIKTDAINIYEDIRENAAFSYYFLCVRDAENIEEDIGKTFAELTGHRDDSKYSALGKALYIQFLDMIKNKVRELCFII